MPITIDQRHEALRPRSGRLLICTALHPPPALPCAAAVAACCAVFNARCPLLPSNNRSIIACLADLHRRLPCESLSQPGPAHNAATPPAWLRLSSSCRRQCSLAHRSDSHRYNRSRPYLATSTPAPPLANHVFHPISPSRLEACSLTTYPNSPALTSTRSPFFFGDWPLSGVLLLGLLSFVRLSPASSLLDLFRAIILYSPSLINTFVDQVRSEPVYMWYPHEREDIESPPTSRSTHLDCPSRTSS